MQGGRAVPSVRTPPIRQEVGVADHLMRLSGGGTKCKFLEAEVVGYFH